MYMGKSYLKSFQELTPMVLIWRRSFLWSFSSTNLLNYHISDTCASFGDLALILRMYGRSALRMVWYHQNTSTDTEESQCTGRHPFGAKHEQNPQAP